MLTYLTDDYDLRNVCEGTGERNNYQYYLDRKRLTGDLHGQAALLWCAYALTNSTETKKYMRIIENNNLFKNNAYDVNTLGHIIVLTFSKNVRYFNN